MIQECVKNARFSCKRIIQNFFISHSCPWADVSEASLCPQVSVWQARCVHKSMCGRPAVSTSQCVLGPLCPQVNVCQAPCVHKSMCARPAVSTSQCVLGPLCLRAVTLRIKLQSFSRSFSKHVFVLLSAAPFQAVRYLYDFNCLKFTAFKKKVQYKSQISCRHLRFGSA